jgi:hypothetical protein
MLPDPSRQPPPPAPGPITLVRTDRKHRRRNEALSVLALLVGLGVLGVLASRAEDGSGSAPTADPFTTAARAFQSAAPGATETCCRTLALTLGDGSARDDEDLEAFAVLIGSLGFTDATLGRMAATRALDGMQTAESDEATMWWTYHPDDGLQVIIEPAG